MTMHEPTFPARTLQGVVRALRQAGHEPEPLLEQFSVNASDLRGDGRIAHSIGECLYQAATELTGDPSFGLRIGAATDAADHGALGMLYALLEAPRQAIDAHQRFASLFHDRAEVTWRREGELVVIGIALRGLSVTRPMQDATLATVVQRIRTVLPFAWSPREVRFSYPAPADASAYQRYFGCAVTFGAPGTAIVVRARSFAVIAPLSQLANTVQSFVGSTLARVRSDTDARQAVRELIMSGRLRGPWTAQSIARQLGTSVRSLQRRLSRQDTSVHALLDELRYELARQKLATQESLQSIADALGFADVRSFSRAYKRWSGVTPSFTRSGS